MNGLLFQLPDITENQIAPDKYRPAAEKSNLCFALFTFDVIDVLAEGEIVQRDIKNM